MDVWRNGNNRDCHYERSEVIYNNCHSVLDTESIEISPKDTLIINYKLNYEKCFNKIIKK